MSYGNQRSNTGGYQRILIVFCISVALLCEGVSAGQVNQVKKCAEINEYVSSERCVVVDPVFFFVCLFILSLFIGYFAKYGNCFMFLTIMRK